MLTGRKLLLADDSVAIQKVIDLTFSDEGMKVTTVGDGRSALEELEQFPPPDVVLADVFMPEVSGYELCRLIKQNERFAQIPVILLVSSFEPFDEAEARRAGADDIVTKPFQSIRQLVSRVGSLLGGGDDQHQQTSQQYSTLGLTRTEPQTDEAPAAAEQNVTVLVEAPMMNIQESEEAAGTTCAADVELQTADTKKLERVTNETDEARSADADEPRVPNPIEMEAINYSEESESTPAIEAEPMYSQFAQTAELVKPAVNEPVKASDDALLDLDDSFTEAALSDDVYLDLDFEEPLPAVTEAAAEPTSAPEAISSADVILAEAAPSDESAATADAHAWSIVSETTTSELPVTVADEKAAPIDADGQAGLSADAIDAIARRVVEQMSDKAVREIAWEVVPELAELLIKKKLEEQK